MLDSGQVPTISAAAKTGIALRLARCADTYSRQRLPAIESAPDFEKSLLLRVRALDFHDGDIVFPGERLPASFSDARAAIH